MKVKHYIALAALTLPLAASAQSNEIDFETTAGYKSVGVFDTWENSPFRTGTLKGNVKVVNNPNQAADEWWRLGKSYQARVFTRYWWYDRTQAIGH